MVRLKLRFCVVHDKNLTEGDGLTRAESVVVGLLGVAAVSGQGGEVAVAVEIVDFGGQTMLRVKGREI